MIEKLKRREKFKKIILLVLCFIILIVIVLLLFNNKSTKQEELFDMYQSTSFFISGDNSKYALFNEKGKNLTGFKYNSVSDIVNGYAIVKDDKNYGILSDQGKMTISFGKYEKIEIVSGLFKVTDKYNNQFIIDGSGKVLYDLSEVNMYNPASISTYLILEIKNSKKYKIINYKGEEVLNFDLVENTNIPQTNSFDEYVSVFYNNKEWIANLNTKEVITTFDATIPYCINLVKDNGNKILLNSCTTNTLSKLSYKVYDNSKVYDFDSKCDKVLLNNTDIICKDIDDNEYVLDDNYNISIENEDIAYVDSETYVKKDDSSVKFYQNGEVIKTKKCRQIYQKGYMSKDLYVLGKSTSILCGNKSGYEIYKTDGENLTDKTYISVSKIDDNGLLVVSEEKNKLYLMDSTGKAISEEYSYIQFLKKDYYTVTKDNKKGIIDKTGKLIVPCEFNKVDIVLKNNRYYASLTNENQETVLYDLYTGKRLTTLTGKVSLMDKYILVKEDNKNKYYLYKSGKKFYQK